MVLLTLKLSGIFTWWHIQWRYSSTFTETKGSSLLGLQEHLLGILPFFLGAVCHFVQFIWLLEQSPGALWVTECSHIHLLCPSMAVPLAAIPCFHPQASFRALTDFPGPSKPPSYPGTRAEHQLIIKQFLLLIENSLQGVNSRRKKGFLWTVRLLETPEGKNPIPVFEASRPVCTGRRSPGELYAHTADTNTRQPPPCRHGAPAVRQVRLQHAVSMPSMQNGFISPVCAPLRM